MVIKNLINYNFTIKIIKLEAEYQEKDKKNQTNIIRIRPIRDIFDI